MLTADIQLYCISASGDAPVAKKSRQDFMKDFEEDDDDDEQRPPADEIAAYLQLRLVKQDNSGDILAWWREHVSTFPKLSELARQHFCVPASSAASERAFSAAGRTITARRTALDPETVDNVLFVNSNISTQ